MAIADDELGETSRQVKRDLAISLLALVSLGIGIWQLRRPPSPTFTFLDALDLVIVLLFAVDFAWAARRCGWARYLKRHWWELPSMIPASAVFFAGASALVVARGLRLVRVVRALRLLRMLGLLARFRGAWRYVRRVAKRARIARILGVAVVVVALGTLLEYATEHDENPNVATLGDALWWTVNLFTNVAYVGFAPVTVWGRALAVALEVSGIAFIGIFTASLASAILKEPEPDEDVAAADA